MCSLGMRWLEREAGFSEFEGEGLPGLDVRSEIGLPTAAAGRNAAVEIYPLIDGFSPPL